MQKEPIDVSSNAMMRARLLIKKAKALQIEPDQALRLFMRLTVDSAHEYKFDHKYRGGIDYHLPVEPGDEWLVGEVRLIERSVNVPVLPYCIYLYFNLFNNEDEFVERIGGAKGLTNLGWWADLSE
jgi:hypothetical protein